MKTKTYKVYKFSELSEDAKERAIQKCTEFAVDGEWWDCTFEDAKNVGITIEEFDIDRASYCRGKIYDVEETANKIIAEHGSKCETYLTAAEYLKERGELVAKHSDGVNTDIVAEDNEYEFDCELDELDAEFEKSIFEDYRIMLTEEYEYITSEECIIENIETNGYEFKDNGQID